LLQFSISRTFSQFWAPIGPEQSAIGPLEATAIEGLQTGAVARPARADVGAARGPYSARIEDI